MTDAVGLTAQDTAVVTVANVAPMATFGNGGAVNEGSTGAVSFTSPSDPSSADTSAGFTYAFDGGDGDGYGSFSASNSASFATTDSGTRTVKGKVRDQDGGVTEYTATVTILNVAPAVTAPADQSASEGASTAFTLGSFINNVPYAAAMTPIVATFADSIPGHDSSGVLWWALLLGTVMGGKPFPAGASR